ncbi:MAG: chemotaxis protein CheA [Rhodocyclaceae bacterium]|nr:chemotaxis protein CheA [Rhodocyclaceae bacterium]
MEELFSVFAQEAREQLTAMEDGLLRMEQGDQDSDTINSIFRSAHTIKGASGVVELQHIEKFTHILENLLDKLRNGEILLSNELITALLEGCDHIGAMLDRVDQGYMDEDPTIAAAGEITAARLHALTDGTETAEEAEEETAGMLEPSIGTVERSGGESSGSDCWHISIRFGRDVLKMGMEPLAFLRYLLNLGEIVHLTTLTDAMPHAEEMDPECCYLSFAIALRSHASKEQIENVFSFCRDECDLHILPPNSRISDYLDLIERLPEENMRLGEILIKSGALTQEELDEGLRRQTAAAKIAEVTDQNIPALGEIFVDNKMVQPEIVEAAAIKQKQVAEKKTSESRLIRVQADKLDQLIDLVGELVIAGASANLLAQKSGRSNLVEATSVLSRLVEDIRDSALQLRMVQIGETFNRFNRVVRDTAKELGKDIDLIITGAETELDKSVVEKIGDPLMHLVRNAMDHGIEPANVREAAGKPAKGRVELNAFHDSGSIVIEVVDDGGGLNAERIQAKAIERGIIQPGQVLSEQEICNLIFEAGFSTADKVSNLSGRGVGMDVVKRNIQALRGTVEVQTRLGVGSRFIIRLPLTLAIIDGFLTAVDNAAYVIPLSNVVECLELQEDTTRGHMINLRGEVLPFIRLREFFDVEGTPPKRENIVVISAGGHKAGIVVDQLLGEFQTVIKPLGNLFKHLRGIGGSTILGSGEVALILDVQALTQLASQSEDRRHPIITHASSHPATEAETR